MRQKIMGILNVTPDSCIDQGRWYVERDPAPSIARGIEIWKEGADCLDVGGESTRPGATPVSEEEELRRVIPVIEALAPLLPIPISIDTTKASVAAAAIQAGARLINDISGGSDPKMVQLAKETGTTLCVMHMQGTPATMQINPSYPDGIVPELILWFQRRIDALLKAGIASHKIWIDPGIGFGKTVEHNLEILRNLHAFQTLGFPLLLGVCRKSFLGKILGKTYPDLLPASLAAHAFVLAQKSVDWLRVHDVAATCDLLRIWEVLQKPS